MVAPTEIAVWSFWWLAVLRRSLQNRAVMHPDRSHLVCPRDAASLSIRELGAAWYGSCERCGGIWIDRAELDELVEGGSAPPAAYPTGEFQIMEGTALCSCEDQPVMRRLTRDAVSIDVCPSCHAIWFDAGEIQCIVAAEREAALRKGLSPIARPTGPLEAASTAFDLLDLLAFVVRAFGRGLG
jgi:Zn-finger nucleic acid-binding protein